MFTWICPKCGSEVPPSENDCPNCRAREKTPAVVSSAAAPPPPSASPATPSVPAPPPAPPTPAVAQALRPPEVQIPVAKGRSPISPALVMICSAVGLVALLALLYGFVLPRGATSSTEKGRLALQNPPQANSTFPPAHPLAKYVQVTGIRIMEGGAGRAKIAYVVVNHSPADLPDLRGQLTLSSGGSTVFDVPVEIPSIGPYESKDLSASVGTKLKSYELPDWKTLTPSLRILSEQ